jgi:hypothetical protein
MKTQAMDKAKPLPMTASIPLRHRCSARLPLDRQFKWCATATAGTGSRRASRLTAECALPRCQATPSRAAPHTFQISSRIHLYDRWFCGLLRHSCSPNVYFDIHYLEVWTLEAITAGSC